MSIIFFFFKSNTIYSKEFKLISKMKTYFNHFANLEEQFSKTVRKEGNFLSND